MSRLLAERRAARDALPKRMRSIVPDPDHDHVHALAISMASPIIRGYLSGSEAYAALAVAALKLDNGQAVLDAAWQTLANHVAHQRNTKDRVARWISERLSPFIDEHRPRNALLSEAHDVNGAAGFPLTEDEVTDCATQAAWLSLPRTPRRRRRGS